MCSPTVERSHITVKSAGAHSAEQELWKPTFASTLEKSHLNARNVVSPVLEAILSNNIWPGIQQKMISLVLRCDADHNLIQLLSKCPWPFLLFINKSIAKTEKLWRLVTNISHFRRVPDVDLWSWRKPTAYGHLVARTIFGQRTLPSSITCLTL